MKQSLTLAILGVWGAGAFGAEPTAADVLAKVSERYRNMQTFLIEADTQVAVSQGRQVGMGETQTVLAVGKEGAFRV